MQVRDDLAVMGCSAMLDKYDSYSVKVQLPFPQIRNGPRNGLILN